MNILIVEDDPNLCMLWHALFSSGGHRVEMAASAIDARRALMATGFDLVILDFCLGQEAGFSVASVAASSNPGCRIVVVTGSAMVSSGRVLERSSAITSVLRKPVDIEHLMAVCAHVGDIAGGAQASA